MKMVKHMSQCRYYCCYLIQIEWTGFSSIVVIFVHMQYLIDKFSRLKFLEIHSFQLSSATTLFNTTLTKWNLENCMFIKRWNKLLSTYIFGTMKLQIEITFTNVQFYDSDNEIIMILWYCTLQQAKERFTEVNCPFDFGSWDLRL